MIDAAVVELLPGAGLGCEVMPVMVTGGEAETKAQGYWRAPKRDHAPIL